MLDNLRQIRGFLCVAHWGSFTRASIELNVSQSALTVQVQQLEAALGVKLLNRTKRVVALTPAGQDLVGPLERILVDVESLMTASRDLAGLRRGRVRIAAVPSLAATLLPRAVGEFCKSYPGVSVALKDSVGNLMELVKSGQVDFGVGGEMQRDRDVTVQDLYTEPICVFAPMSHPLAEKKRVTLAEVAEHPTILPQPHSSLRAILQRALDQAHISLRPFHETSHISTTIGMVTAGLGIAILPLRAMDCFFASNVRCIAIHKPTMERRVVIATKSGHSVPPPVQKFIDILHRIARDLPKRFPAAR